MKTITNDFVVTGDNVKCFWKAIKLYLTKPQVINRRLAGAVRIACFAYFEDISKAQHNTIVEALQSIGNGIDKEKVNSTLKHGALSMSSLEELEFSNKLNHSDATAGFIVVNKLLAKNLKLYQNCYELIVLDLRTNTTTFWCIGNGLVKSNNSLCSQAEPPFSVQYLENCNKFIVQSNADDVNSAANVPWLNTGFQPKFQKWFQNFIDETSDSKDSPAPEKLESISLIDLEEYSKLYNELKNKYGLDMVKKWPERTDPSKFVYEDIAIATYLLIIWQQERQLCNSQKLQSFVDLGCGNGLLVYILSAEGHPGVGIDLRKRGIWDQYPATTILKEEAITPSDSSLFPDTDWIIGNHSDELSPWIPVIAARSSYHCRYFLLPCCAFEFDGQKYQRRNAKLSQYNDFLDYAKEISDICGFQTKMDRLRIPSTKRVCLIGQTRIGSHDEFNQQCQAIQSFINQRTKCTNNAQTWSNSFTPRSAIELVKNCSKIDKTIQEEIVQIVFQHLLTKKRFSQDFINPHWNMGGIAALCDLVQLIPVEKLQKLKSECGGLQTLLKNSHHIFLVEKGSVQVRKPLSYAERLKHGVKNSGNKNFVFKQKDCWFLKHHPDGCPFSMEDCSFRHNLIEE